VAAAVTPALALMLLQNAPLRRRRSPVVGWLDRRYEASAPRVITRTGAGLGAFGLLAVAALIATPFLDISLRPALNERQVVVGFEAPPGTSLPRMTSIADQAVEELTTIPGVLDANAQVGRAVMSDKAVNVDRGEVWVSLDPDADYDATLASIDDAMAGYPDITSEVMTYSDQRVRDLLQENNDDVVVRVYGEDPGVLDAKVEEVRDGLTSVEGIAAVDVESTPQESTIEVEVDLDRAREMGIKPGDVRRAAAMLLGGIIVGHLFEEQKVFDVVVWGAPEIRQDQSDIESLLIDTPDGSSIRLGDVAEVRNVPNAAVIRHESVARYLEVTADVEGRDVADVTDEVDAMLQDTAFPLDHHAEVIDGFAERQADRSRLIAVAIAAAVAVLLLLQAAFRSWRLALLAFISLPVAMTGGILAIVALGGDLTLGALGGLVAVLGIAARGAILLLRRFQDLQHREGMEFGPEVVVRGTGDRLAPTLMSTLAIAALLVPTAVMASTMTGLEILQPAVITILGGLLTTAVVELLVLPSLYLRFGAVSDPDAWADELIAPDQTLHPVHS
jgi:Cu/Ag efflux pump CusA